MGSSKKVDSHVVMCGLPNTTPRSPIIPRTDNSLQGNGSDCKTKRGGGRPICKDDEQRNAGFLSFDVVL